MAKNINSSKETFAPFKNSKMSEMMPALNAAAHLFGLNLNRPHLMRVAVRVINNSIKKN